MKFKLDFKSIGALCILMLLTNATSFGSSAKAAERKPILSDDCNLNELNLSEFERPGDLWSICNMGESFVLKLSTLTSPTALSDATVDSLIDQYPDTAFILESTSAQLLRYKFIFEGELLDKIGLGFSYYHWIPDGTDTEHDTRRQNKRWLSGKLFRCHSGNSCITYYDVFTCAGSDLERVLLLVAMENAPDAFEEYDPVHRKVAELRQMILVESCN